MSKFLLSLTFSILYIIIVYQPAYAYIDPSTGSYLLQLLLAGLLGALFAVKMFLRNLKSYFSNLLNKGESLNNDKLS